MPFLPAATDFTDMEILSKPKEYPDLKTICPICKGYGGWNSELNCYRLPPGVEDTAENRCKYVHFQAGCSQCNGWGWVSDEGANCIHEMKELSQKECRKRGIQHFGNCYHVYECIKCSKVEHVDSSD